MLIHSLLVGPLTWQATADELRERFCAETPSLPLAYFAEPQPGAYDIAELLERW